MKSFKAVSRVLFAILAAVPVLASASPREIFSMSPAKLKKAEISSLCAEGTMCIVGGTKVLLQYQPICVSSIENVVAQTVGDKLVVSAVEVFRLDPRVVLCAPTEAFQTFEISLPGVYLNSEDDVISLETLVD